MLIDFGGYLVGVEKIESSDNCDNSEVELSELLSGIMEDGSSELAEAFADDESCWASRLNLNSDCVRGTMFSKHLHLRSVFWYS